MKFRHRRVTRRVLLPGEDVEDREATARAFRRSGAGNAHHRLVTAGLPRREEGR